MTTWRYFETSSLVTAYLAIISKSSSTLRLLLDCPNYLRTARMNVADLEAECIVFATEGLLLAHDFISDCGIRDYGAMGRLLDQGPIYSLAALS